MAMPSADMTRQLIVTADDFNLSAGVSRGILEAHQHGIVTETSVMVNLGDLPQAVAMLATAPQLATGLHLNITRGRPLAPPSLVAEILRDGQFLGSPPALPPHLRSAAVRAEFQAQVDSFVRAFGRLPQHLDTHHHVHRHPVILETLLDLAVSLRVPVRSIDSAMHATMAARDLRSPTAFLGDAADEPYWTIERLQAALLALRPGITELMCHPGYFDAVIGYSRYGPQRDVERQALCAPEVVATLRAQEVQLVTYAAV